MPALLAGTRALVTGAAGGIGRAVAEAFREHGAQVTATDLLGSAEVAACDVTDEASVREVFGSGGFDHVVHAAGTASIGTIADLTVAEFRRVLEVNLIGAFVVGREAARSAGAARTITFIASQGARKGGARWGAYCASKFGVIGLAESLAQELGMRGARVNCVCPGTVDTEMTSGVVDALARAAGEPAATMLERYRDGVPLGRLATGSDVADVCVFLASPLARYVSGASIVVDGGELS